MIPKVFHIIWVGDDSKRPDNCIATWGNKNPGWQVKVWGNDALKTRPWRNKAHIETQAANGAWQGVADMMRYEILLDEGGLYVDADMVCLQALPDSLLEFHAFACWENEKAVPGLIANNILGAHAGDALLKQLVETIHARTDIATAAPYKATGPAALTDVWIDMKYTGLKVLPSHMFIPLHHSGESYTGNEPVYAAHFWAGTRYTSLFDTLYKQDITDWRSVFPHLDPRTFDERMFDGMFGEDDFITTMKALETSIRKEGRVPHVVQIGAMNGVDFDPLRVFIADGGWRALLVEPMPHHFASLQKSYPGRDNVHFENAAIAGAEGPVTMYYVPDDEIAKAGLPRDVAGMASTLRERNLHNHRDAQKILKHQQTLAVPGITMAQMFTKHGVTDFDMYVSDLEGADWPVLQQLDLTRYRPQLILVEFAHILPADVPRFAAHMRNNGYKVYIMKDTHSDALCVRHGG